MRRIDFISQGPQLSIFKEDANKTNLGGSKITYVSLQKEYEEDKELLDLLSSSKSKRNLFII